VSVRLDYDIHNHDRSVGARASGAIAKRWGNLGMPGTVQARFSGSAGQSFGAFNAGGLELDLVGEANDYVGKGMAGGRLVLRPRRARALLERATRRDHGQHLPVRRDRRRALRRRHVAGERFAVRNSGATAVVEGAGDHCCEYMTGGVVAVLGRTGLNFGAGLTGGFAYVLDLDRDFVDRYNHELIDIHRMSTEGMEQYVQHLRALIEAHQRHTGSAWGRRACSMTSATSCRKFWLVKPKAASRAY
jgi:glutamate synthase (NADPH) large chain